jgi:dTDP-glucose pyrophosphorylase
MSGIHDGHFQTLADESWRKVILPITANIGQAIRNLDQFSVKIVLVVNERMELEGTISDGDIRRGLLRGLDLNSPVTSVVHRNALVAPLDMKPEMVMQLMRANKIKQIPVVDKQQNLVGLHFWDQIAVPAVRSNLMVIMAGGMGKRLLPHTQNCPKPLLSVAGKPMLEHIIERAKLEGFNQFALAIHYLGHMIEEHFGDGERLDVQIEYLREQRPLGTSGALRLLNPRPDMPFLVTNGDVISDIRYGDLLDFHSRNEAAATMAVRAYEWRHPFGVVNTKGIEIVGFEEKPVIRHHINAGVYAFNPDAINVLGANESCDMPTLFERLQAKSKRIVAYPMHEPWLDVGREDDLSRANDQVVNKNEK